MSINAYCALPHNLLFYRSGRTNPQQTIQENTMLGQVLAHAAVAGTRAYALLGELLSVSVLMIALNALATATEKIYVAGAAVGSFYKQHRLGHKAAVAAKHAVCGAMFASELAWDGAKYVYARRDTILKNANQTRNSIGELFTYTSPALV